MARITSLFCDTWHSTSCRRTDQKTPCGESSSEPVGTTPTSPDCSDYSEMRLPWPSPEQRMKQTLGGPLPGVLAEYIVVPAEDTVAAPAQLSDVEAASLPIAGLTAWTTLQEGGIKPGDAVVLLGTGGVALFALQFAKLAGAQ